MKTARIIPVLALALAACAELPVSVNVPIPVPAAPVSAPAVPAGPRVGEDQHFVQADDWFIADQPLESGWMYVYLAKQRVAPTPGTKMQGQYFKLADSRDVWTAQAWQTRPASTSDLRVGNTVICFEGPQVNDAYGPPRTKDDGRTGTWFMGRITDTSDAFKNVVRIDQYNCHTSALRVAR